MKTKFTVVALMVCCFAFAQIPSINQTKPQSQTPSLSTIIKTEEIKSIDKEITPLKKDLDTLKQTISTKITTVNPIITSSQDVANKALLQKIAKQNADIKAQRAEINSQNAEIKLQKQKIEQHNQKITNQNNKIDTLNGEIIKQKEAITTQNEAISKQNEAIKEQNKEVAKLKEVTEKDDFFQVESYISKYDELIKDQKEKIKKKKYEQKNKPTMKEMEAMDVDIVKLETQLDSLKDAKDIKVKELSYNWCMPSKNKDKRDYFFQTMYNSKDSKTKFLNSFGFTGNAYGISGQSELITDNVGWCRLAFGTVVTGSNNNDDVAPEDETSLQALDRLVNGGGNFYIETVLPLVTTIDRNNSDLITLYGYFSARAATDIKGYGNDIDTSTGNGSAGLNLYLGLSSESRKFNFFFQGNANYTMGSKEFYQNLAIDHNNGFFNGKFIAGLTLENKLRFMANLTYGSEPSLRREKITLGVQFLP